MGVWGKGSPMLRGSARGGRPLREAKRVRFRFFVSRRLMDDSYHYLPDENVQKVIDELSHVEFMGNRLIVNLAELT
jgi:hypothetical protein